MGRIKVRLHAFGQILVLYSIHHADDRHPCLVTRSPYTFSDGISVGPVLVGQSLVHDHHWRRIRLVRFDEIAPPLQGNAHGMKIPGAYSLKLRLGWITARWRLMPLHNVTI